MKQQFKNATASCLIVLCSNLATYATQTNASGLPSLGDYSSSIVSLDTEYKLGQRIIRQIRNANDSIDDPITESYVHDLIWDLVTTSQLSDKRISPVVIGNLSVNAFAAPGGVLGIHSGIILAAQSEAELASVISHELAHLSQRHFAAQLEQQRLSTPFSMASLLAGILVSVANPQAGIAVLTGGQASQISSALAFSRRNEQEADRIGMLNLVNSGYDAFAMPKMFSRLYDLQKLQGSVPPEFLLTHPTSSSRIADSRNRAEQTGRAKSRRASLDFDIIQARLDAKFAQKRKLSINHFRSKSQNSNNAKNTFTLALVAANSQQYGEAKKLFSSLPKSWRNHLLVQLSVAEVDINSRHLKEALISLKRLNQNYPKHIAIQLLYAQAFLAAGQANDAIKQLKDVTQYAADSIEAWYLISEAYGLAGNQAQTHVSRIEYFLLKGQVSAAERQLSFARREQRLSQEETYMLDDLEAHIAQVKSYMNVKF